MELYNISFRTLADNGKKLIAVRSDTEKLEQDVKLEIVDLLKVSCSESVKVLLVDKDRKTKGVSWGGSILKILA